ncbi:hypothetical protein [Luteimonas arsenica]|uniref:hypothetical protein n=1 Tax=Luteimonas arsenica TaxID=1586242 RepID=UPI00105418FE|nr:hypothetical protein [Luteimonas arsenica]
MKTLQRVIGILMVVGGIAGAVACTWALVDPSIMQASPPGAFDPPSPRWRAAFGLVFSIAMLLFGSGRLRHRPLP